MSPRASQADVYTCDECKTTQPEPLHSGWFEVDRPPGVVGARMDDWWGWGTRYFCSATCLHARLGRQLQAP